MIRCAILGASGFVGGELLRLLEGHSQFAAMRLFGDSKAGQPAGVVHRQLSGTIGQVTVDHYASTALEDIDLVFAALPHGQSQKIAGEILASGCKLVDLGALTNFWYFFNPRESVCRRAAPRRTSPLGGQRGHASAERGGRVP